MPYDTGILHARVPKGACTFFNVASHTSTKEVCQVRRTKYFAYVCAAELQIGRARVRVRALSGGNIGMPHQGEGVMQPHTTFLAHTNITPQAIFF